MQQIVRTHDTFYINEERYEKPKQMFTQIINEIREIPGHEKSVIADFGCAAGEFVYALRKIFPTAEIEGYDLLEELIAKAKRMIPQAKFFVGSITDPNLCAPDHADFTLCTGVISIFDTFEPIIGNLIHWTKPGGHVFLQGLFNNNPIDINVKYNLSEDYGKGMLEAGWNVFSKCSITTWLNQHPDVASFGWNDFQIEVDLPKQEDPVRSWTFSDADGKRIITNGLCLLQPHSILKISKK